MNNQRFTETPRDARAYTCSKCGTETVVSEDSFVQICNPFTLTLGTMCCTCGVVGLGTVKWSETGESVARYRGRLRTLPPAWVRFMPLWLTPAGAAVGALGGLASMSGLRASDALVMVTIYAIMGGAAALVFGVVMKLALSRRTAGVSAWTNVD